MTLRQLLRKPFVSTAFANPVDLSGKHIIVTGCGPGSLGYETALQLSNWGATVIITTRSAAATVVETLDAQGNVGGRIDGHNLDLSDAASVNRFCAWYQQHYGERLDCLINNAGIHFDLLSKWQQPKLSEDGHEIHWRTNYLGSAHLTHNLLALLKQTGLKYGDARIVNVVSQLHSRGSNALLFDEDRDYESWQAYGLSKLALVHLSKELDRSFAHSHNLKSLSLHPGGKSGAYTNVADKGLQGHAIMGFIRKLGAPLEKLLMASAQEGAQTQIYCASAAEVQGGRYYLNCHPARANADADDPDAAMRLWRETQQWLADTATSAQQL
jgi:NAD(P)-dependent dehydrogenase (short-subunit alcohol dehydrogenase family)